MYNYPMHVWVNVVTDFLGSKWACEEQSIEVLYVVGVCGGRMCLLH